MDKIRFEAFLREKLAILKDEEINEIISEYLQHIDMRIEEGKSEEEAIKDFGDMDVLVQEILDAYKIDTQTNQFDDFGNKVKDWLDIAFDYVGDISKSIMQRSAKEIVVLVIEFFLVIVLLWAVNAGVKIVSNTLIRIFYFRPFSITQIIRMAIGVLSTLASLLISLTILYWFANERILNNNQLNSQKIPQKSDFQNNNIKNTAVRTNETVANANKDSLKARKVMTPTNKDKYDENNLDKNKAKRLIAENQSIKNNNQKSFAQLLFDGNMFILKIILFVILIPAIVIGVFGGFAWVFVIYHTIIGIGSYGLSLILTGGLLIYYYILILGLKLVSGGKSS